MKESKSQKDEGRGTRQRETIKLMSKEYLRKVPLSCLEHKLQWKYHSFLSLHVPFVQYILGENGYFWKGIQQFKASAIRIDVRHSV